MFRPVMFLAAATMLLVLVSTGAYGKPAIDSDEHVDDAISKKDVADTLGEVKKAWYVSPRLGKRAYSLDPRLGKKAYSLDPRLGKKAWYVSPRLGKKAWYVSPRLGKKAWYVSPRLGKKAYELDPRLGGKRDAEKDVSSE